MTADASMGSGGVHPDLVGLLRGELGNAEVFAAAGHLSECQACRADLAETAVGHALLSRTVRTLGRDGANAADATASPPPLPAVADLEVAFPEQPVQPRRGLRILAVAAAMVVVAGLGVGVGTVVADRDDAPPSPQQTATLEAVTGDGSGEVSMTEDDGRTRMTIRTQDLPAANQGQFYYAWLLDPATNKMLPLGQVGPSGTASFEVSDTLLAAYSAVDVSLEDDDGDPQHSPTSVLRATYA